MITFTPGMIMKCIWVSAEVIELYWQNLNQLIANENLQYGRQRLSNTLLWIIAKIKSVLNATGAASLWWAEPAGVSCQSWTHTHTLTHCCTLMAPGCAAAVLFQLCNWCEGSSLLSPSGIKDTRLQTATATALGRKWHDATRVIQS